MDKGVLDLSDRALKGVLLLTTLAGGAYVLWLLYKRKQSQEALSPSTQTITVAVPPLKKPKTPKKKAKK